VNSLPDAVPGAAGGVFIAGSNAATTVNLTGNLSGSVGSVTGLTASDVGAIKAKTDNLPTDPADESLVIAATDAIYARLGAPAGASLSADVAAVKSDTADVAAIKAKTDNLPAAPAAVGDVPTATANADALLKRDLSVVSGEASRSVLNALRFLRNKWTIAAGTLTVTKEDDATTAWTGSVTTDAAADQVTGVDPA
jgi:hypothetical protein